MIRKLIRAANGLLTGLEVLGLVLVGAYAGYALWDNHQVYQEAENVQADMMRLKPKVSETSEESGGPSFEELLKINKDVCGWITMDNTEIDHPILQGDTNLSYINTDVYGNFALSGSIFLDTRCDSAFNDAYSLVYGHHMTDHMMFGDLDLYKEKDFFENNRTGILIMPEGIKYVETLGCMLIYASDDMIFEPELARDKVEELLQYVKEESLHFDEKAVLEAEESIKRYKSGETAKTPQILVLSTCASEFTDARTVLVTVLHDEKATDNEKYTFRCFLLRLGFIGNEYKQSRKILLRNLSGSSAFKSGAAKEVANDEIPE